MEFPVPSLPQFAGPQSGWRKAAYIAGAVAAVELVLLLVVGLAFVARPFAGDDGKASKKDGAAQVESAKGDAAPVKATMPETEPADAEIPRSKTPVLVLNGNGISGAAATKAARIGKLRYPIVSIGDAQRRTFPHTIVMYRPGFKGEGQRLAMDLGLARARAVPLDGMKASELDGARLVLVIGNNG